MEQRVSIQLLMKPATKSKRNDTKEKEPSLVKAEKSSHQPWVLREDVGKPWNQPQKDVGLSKARLLQTDRRVRRAGPERRVPNAHR